MNRHNIGVHFSPDLIAKIGTEVTAEWAAAIREWHHKGDPDWYFGRNVSNSLGVENTWAWHLHYVPEATSTEAVKKWDRTSNSYYRTSNRLVVYSMDKKDPLKYGFLMLAFLQPDGHEQLQFGPSAAERRQDWEDIAYTHQMTGNVPDGTISES